MTSQIFTKSKSITGASQPEIHVAALGKHPAWNDFIDDPGLETDRLIAVKRVIYLEGIAAAIEQGTWDKLEAAQRTEGFAHLVVWRSRGEIVIGRFWSSSDGKGRTKYPMAVVAQCRGMSLAWVLAEAMPRLERLERRCRDATTQEQVRAALGATRQELRARAAVAEAGGPIDSGAVGEVAASLTEAGSRELFYRLMYQVERDWGAFLTRRPDSATSTRTWSGELRSQHARVPSGDGLAAEGISRWMHFVLSLVDSATSVTLIRSTEAGSLSAAWTDLIVGEPEGPQFFCMRASDHSLPLATSIPYTLDAAFKARCDRLVEDSRSGQLSAAKPEVVTAGSVGLIQRVKGILGGKKKGLLVLLIAGGLVGAGVGIALISGASGRRGEREDVGRAESPREPPARGSDDRAAPGTGVVGGERGAEGAGGPALLGAGEAGEWGRLCAAYHDWFAEFVQRLERKPSAAAGMAGASVTTRGELYATDLYLNGLLERLRVATAAGRAIDPWSIAGVARSEDLADLAKRPPAAVAEAGTKVRIDEAMAIIDGFSTKLATEWPVVATLDETAGTLEAAGLTAEAAYVRSVVASAAGGAGGAGGPGQGDPAAVIDAVIGVSAVAGEVRRRLEIRDGCARLAGMTNDRVLREFAGWAARTAPGTGGGTADLAALEDLSAALGRVAEVAEPLGVFLSEKWGATDAELVSRRTGGAAGAVTRETFLAWLRIAKESPKLDTALDPRGDGRLDEALDGARAARGRLEGEFKAAPERRLIELQVAAESGLATLNALPFDAQTRGTISESAARLEGQLRELRQGLENALAIEGAKRAGTAREVRESLAAQQTIVSRSDAINSAWRTGRDALMAASADADYAQLRVSADALRAALVSLEEVVPAGMEASGADAVSRTVAAASWSGRERVIAGVLEGWKGIGGDAGGAALREAGAAAASAYGRSLGELRALEHDARTVAENVAAGASLSDRLASGEPLATVVERVRRSEFMKSEAMSAAVGPVLRDVEAMERVESLVGAGELADAAEGALPERWPLALAAWRRLGRVAKPAWPDSLGALRREAAVSGTLLAAVAVGAGERREALEREIVEQRAARWARCFASLSEPGDIEAAAAMASEMGGVSSRLDARTRYNLELALFKRSGAAGTLSDDQARERASSFEGVVRGLGEDVVSAPGVAQLMERLGPVLGREARSAPLVDVTRLGPGAVHGGLAGFSGELDGDVLRFTRARGTPGELTLEFVRVEAPGVETFFLGTTEVSLAQFVALVDAAGAWKDVGGLFTSTAPGDDFRKGPRVWRWSTGGQVAVMRPAEKWLRELATGRQVADAPPGLAAGVPKASHPVNYVPPTAALYVAHLGGCRLPTLEEWKAGVNRVGALTELSKCNLRDQQWKAEQAYVAGLARSGSVNWPDDDAFVPVGGGKRVRTGADAGVHPWDDGSVWLSPVDSGSGAAKHLVGNVAEYVMDVPAAELVAGASGVSVAGAKAVMARGRTVLRVVGGSALSPLELDPGEAVGAELDEALGGYADVGFRLAFSAAGAGPGREPLGVQLANVLREAGYLIEGEHK